MRAQLGDEPWLNSLERGEVELARCRWPCSLFDRGVSCALTVVSSACSERDMESELTPHTRQLPPCSTPHPTHWGWGCMYITVRRA